MALLLSAALGMSPYAEAFWARDAGRLHQALENDRVQASLENRSPPPGHAFFTDLLRFVSCQPLARLEDDAPDWPLRVLLRVEEARGRRLAAAADAPAGADKRDAVTLWHSLRQRDPLRRRENNARRSNEGELVWPLEAESWSDETWLVSPTPQWGCGAQAMPTTTVPNNEEQQLLSHESLFRAATHLQSARVPPGLAQDLVYQRTLTALRGGDLEAARDASAGGLDARQPSAALLRLELGLDDARGYASLLEQAPAALSELPRGLLEARACENAMGKQDATSALRFASMASELSGKSAYERYALYCRAEAEAALGQVEAAAMTAQRAFPDARSVRDDVTQALRERIVESLGKARAAEQEEAFTQLSRLAETSELPFLLSRLGSAAVSAQNTTLATEVARRLAANQSPQTRLRGWVLQAEIAFGQGHLAAFSAAFAKLFPDESPKSSVRGLRDRLVVELCHRLVNTSTSTISSSASPLLRALREAMRRAQPQLHSRLSHEMDRLMAAVASASRPARSKARHAVALGEVQVTAARPLFPSPPRPAQWGWPEVHSLLALPHPDGSFRAWFEETETPNEVAHHAR